MSQVSGEIAVRIEEWQLQDDGDEHAEKDKDYGRY
jgi:hypothetical protein